MTKKSYNDDKINDPLQVIAIDTAVEAGWVIEDEEGVAKGMLHLPDDASQSWTAIWYPIDHPKYGRVHYPHWLLRRMKELEAEKANDKNSNIADFDDAETADNQESNTTDEELFTDGILGRPGKKFDKQLGGPYQEIQDGIFSLNENQIELDENLQDQILFLTDNLNIDSNDFSSYKDVLVACLQAIKHITSTKIRTEYEKEIKEILSYGQTTNDTHHKTQSSSFQAESWREVWKFCMKLGMPLKQDLKGYECVTDFIETLYNSVKPDEVNEVNEENSEHNYNLEYGPDDPDETPLGPSQTTMPFTFLDGLNTGAVTSFVTNDKQIKMKVYETRKLDAVGDENKKRNSQEAVTMITLAVHLNSLVNITEHTEGAALRNIRSNAEQVLKELSPYVSKFNMNSRDSAPTQPPEKDSTDA